MERTRVLYGKKIVPHHMLNYAEQVFDILVGEIESGRWKTDERLPGVIHLAKELGFGTKTIQTVYDRLRQEGYTQSLGYRGTYLKNPHPRARAAIGKVGVLVSEDQTGHPLTLWYEHVILQVALKRDLVTEVKVLPDSMSPRQVNRKGALFGEDVHGIISLTPFRIPVRFGDSGEDLPVVFLCPPFEPCVPKVCADVREAYYDLTSRVIQCGHTRVVFSEDRVEPDPRQTELHRAGYLAAMDEQGLPVNTELMKASEEVVNSDPASVAAYLDAIRQESEPQRPTAVVAGSLGRSMALARVARLRQVEIPRDLSLVSIGSAPVAERNGPQLTGMLPDFDRMVEMCLKLLDQQNQTGTCDYTKIHFRMHFLPGDTLRTRDGAAASDLRTARTPDIFHDPQTLSQTVEY